MISLSNPWGGKPTEDDEDDDDVDETCIQVTDIGTRCVCRSNRPGWLATSLMKDGCRYQTLN
jgi:hypothetical protein